MKCKVTTLENKGAGDIDLAEEVFGLPPRARRTRRPVVPSEGTGTAAPAVQSASAAVPVSTST